MENKRPRLTQYFKNKKVLVVGGTGSWGSELVRQLVTFYPPSELRIFSRGEHKQVEMRQQYRTTPFLKFIIGDVRDAQAVDLAVQGVDVVFNLAALKHVPVCEENVWEAIQTNIYGAQNIVTAALKHKVQVMVQVSTDKAVDPLNLYGFTKGCAEKVVTSANNSPSKAPQTKFVCVRGGNVLSTNGSVVPLFKHLLKTYNKVTITDKRMSRYLMRVEQAIQLVLKATTECMGGEVYVMKMPGARITDLAEVMVEKLGNKNTKIEYIGMRPGEKLYEVLVSKNEVPRTIEDGDYYIIMPEIFRDALTLVKDAKQKTIELEEYNSRNTFQLDKDGILQLLEEDGWLTESREELFSHLFAPKLRSENGTKNPNI